MTKHKHTPGPWMHEGPDHFRDYNILHQGDALAVAAVVSNMRPSYEIKANAKLIAAAPDLLADLQLAATQLRKYETLHRAKETLESLAKAEVNAELAERFERTIAKATA